MYRNLLSLCLYYALHDTFNILKQVELKLCSLNSYNDIKNILVEFNNNFYDFICTDQSK